VRANPARGAVGRRFDFSYNRLLDREKELLHRMAAFASLIRPQFLEILCTSPEYSDGKALPTWQSDLAELVRKSFVEHLEFVGEDEKGNEFTVSRYRLHPVMRQYAAGKAGLKAMRGHNFNTAQLLLAFARQFKQDFDALESELPNLLGAMDLSEDPSRTVRFALALKDFWDVRGYWREGKERLEQAIGVSQQLNDQRAQAELERSLGMILYNLDDFKAAKRRLGNSFRLSRRISDPEGIKRSLYDLGLILSDQENSRSYRVALIVLQKGLNFAQVLPDQDWAHIIISKQQISKCYNGLERYDDALVQLEACLNIHDEHGINSHRAYTFGFLAITHHFQRDFLEAQKYYRLALNLSKELGDRRHVAEMIAGLGEIAIDMGNYGEAMQQIDQARSLAEEIGHQTLLRHIQTDLWPRLP